jgi:hypothetical protein
MPKSNEYNIDWTWLADQREIQKTNYIRHVRLAEPLYIKIDGRSGRGAVLKNRGDYDK